MSECGLQVSSRFLNPPNLEDLTSNNIDSTNLVNGKPLYYYTNEINLGSNNFTNAGQIFLINCNDCLISNLNTSYCSSGIALYYCNNNNLSGNTASNNEFGIYLYGCDGNDVLGNTVNQNYGGIYLEGSDNNDITGNTVSYNEYGIYLMYSDLNHITTNTISYNIVGILTVSLSKRRSTHNEISNNIFSGNGEDIQESFLFMDTYLIINGFSILILGCAITLSIVLILWKMKYKRVI
jgi:parallel beta-helix repeat protein